ncbi:hypothetical protein ACFOON_13825 [Novosphingobium piscinae]|uniref:Uncharacterized protein n=1 Tax=Novosphingobium piscinae TaxID=1507448 RepID=A0A7X1KPN2_9SPHN|nr:hypothetical protein [Novosphingobium piscinae]MBC2668907.1 hypothetical protein [Novosphingobium piscinae]
MPLASESAIARVAQGLIARTLPKAEWTHEAHFAAALWLLRYRADLAGPEAMRALISAYNHSVGVENSASAGYHHTITIASLRAAAAHLAAAQDQPLPAVLARLMASAQGRSDWLATYWTRDLLFSPAARRDWVEPDLAPLPF